ncbi:unnamed protein product, partial [marine sediment metagenome]
GRQMLAFSIQDGVGLRLWHRTGRRVGMLSGRDVPAVRARAEQLNMDFTVFGRNDKLQAYNELLSTHGLTADQVAYVGDDLLDLPVMARCVWPIAVANALEVVKAAARYVTTRSGGNGAVAEAVQYLLSTAGEWHDCVAAYTAGEAGKEH